MEEVDRWLKDFEEEWAKLEKWAEEQLRQLGVEEASSPTPVKSEREEAPAIGKPSFEKIVDYTWDHLFQQMIGIEDHLKSSDYDICLDCIRKHLPALKLYAQEALTYSPNEEAKKVAKDLLEWADKLKMKVPELVDANVRLALAEELRSIRKRAEEVTSPLNALLSAVKEKAEAKSEPPKESPIRVVRGGSCLDEVEKVINEVAPKVAEAVKGHSEARPPGEVRIAEGTVVKPDGSEACAASNPEQGVIIFHCGCWPKLSEQEKKRLVAHELAHIFGVTDETKAEEIARRAVG